MEAYLHGVSTRTVDDLVEALGYVNSMWPRGDGYIWPHLMMTCRGGQHVIA